MTYTTVYDIANDSVSLLHPLIGLGVILLSAVMKWGFGKSGKSWYPFMACGLIYFLASGPLPWWDYHRATLAAANGETKQVAGPIHDWHLLRGRGKRYNTGSYWYSYSEQFSVGNVNFSVAWNSQEAGFANRGSTEEKPVVRLSNGMMARIWYLPASGLEPSQRIVRIDLAAISRADAVHHPNTGAAPAYSEGRVTDDAKALSDAQKQQIAVRLADFERLTGHQMVVVTTPSLGGQDIALYATNLANKRGIGRRGVDDGILLLVAPNERKVRIAVGRGLESILSDTAAQRIINMAILPLFRRGEIPGGIEAGTAMIIDKVRSEEQR